MVASSAMEHSTFFASLVDLVPAEHYLPAEGPQVNLRYLKRSAREAAKAELRKKQQRNKRARLDPAQARTTQERQRELVAEEAEERIADGVSTSVPEEAAERRKGSASSPSEPAGPRLALQGAVQSREELRQRLQAKLHGLRAQRHVEEKQAGDEEARTWREKKLGKSRQAAQSKRKLQAAFRDDSAELQHKRKSREMGDAAPDSSTTASADDFAFSRINQAEETQEKKGLSKKALLALAEAKQKTERVDKTAEAWSHATARASGQKILDNPKLLKKSLKRDMQLKAKRSKAWKARVEKQVKDTKRRQDKRTENIQARKNLKLKKKIGKREKTLSRAGFEGRTQKFITPEKA